MKYKKYNNNIIFVNNINFSYIRFKKYKDKLKNIYEFK